MKIYVDVVTGTWGEAKDLETLDIDDELLDSFDDPDRAVLELAELERENNKTSL